MLLLLCLASAWLASGTKITNSAQEQNVMKADSADYRLANCKNYSYQSGHYLARFHLGCDKFVEHGGLAGCEAYCNQHSNSASRAACRNGCTYMSCDGTGFGDPRYGCMCAAPVYVSSAGCEHATYWAQQCQWLTPEIESCLTTTASPGVVGDPHLTNLHGEKFDIHDGTHRLVHYPRGAPESEALLVVDARAVDMGSKSDCYSVYLDTVKVFGKWVGEEISISANKTPSGPNTSVVVSFAQKQTDWLALASTPHTKLPLNGTMPITATTSMRKASGEDALGGEEITFEVGVQRPVLVQVWSSHGKNKLTNNEEVRYLNVQLKNLPKNSGGIIGLDGYSRPTTSRCELVQEEKDLMDFIKDDTAEVFLLKSARARLHWTASASVVED